jgi:hypothetical protein
MRYPCGAARSVRKADNLTAICEPTVETMWDPQHVTTLPVPTACYGDSFTLIYVGDIRTSQETHLWVRTACYGDSFTLIYVGNIHASQETHLCVRTACYGDSFTLIYVGNIHTSQETRLWYFVPLLEP